jgi:hypothetical protein
VTGLGTPAAARSPASLYRSQAAVPQLAKHQAAREHVVEGLFARRESGSDAIDQKIVEAEGRNGCQEASAQKASAGSQKGNAAAVGVRDIEAQRALPYRSPPRRAFK